jgi:hypothetical protein
VCIRRQKGFYIIEDDGYKLNGLIDGLSYYNGVLKRLERNAEIYNFDLTEED